MYYFLKGIALKQLFLLFVEDELHSGVDGKGEKKKSINARVGAKEIQT